MASSCSHLCRSRVDADLRSFPLLALDPGLAGGWNSDRRLQHHLGEDSEIDRQTT
ncbi:hypothetical protein RSAG8_09328, partial [Rhizoctonia solani AG-8 WAC10335]